MDKKTYKIRYYVNWRENKDLIEEKIEETTETLEELLMHAHVISAEEVKEKKVEEVKEVKEDKKKK